MNGVWFGVQLAASVTDPVVKVYARDCCTEDFGHTIFVDIGDGSDFGSVRRQTCVTLNGVQNSDVVTAECAGAGQYIFLWADGWLELAELQVFENPAHSRSTEPVEWKLMMDPLSWGNAEASCAHMGGHLASIHSKSMQHDLMQVDDLLAGGASVWIGLKCALATHASFARISLTQDLSNSDVSGEAGCDGDAFTWSDGTENDWSKWADGEPNVRVILPLWSRANVFSKSITIAGLERRCLALRRCHRPEPELHRSDQLRLRRPRAVVSAEPWRRALESR